MAKREHKPVGSEESDNKFNDFIISIIRAMIGSRSSVENNLLQSGGMWNVVIRFADVLLFKIFAGLVSITFQRGLIVL